MSRLPKPAIVMGFPRDTGTGTVSSSSSVEVEEEDDGRVRSYPHERGQWTTHLFLNGE